MIDIFNIRKIEKEHLEEIDIIYRRAANDYINAILNYAFCYFSDVIIDVDDKVDYVSFVLEPFFVRRHGLEKCLGLIDAAFQVIRSNVIYEWFDKPVYEYILFCILDNYASVFNYEKLDDEKAFLGDGQAVRMQFLSDYYNKNADNEDVEWIYLICRDIIKDPELLFGDMFFFPDYLDMFVDDYVSAGGNEEGYCNGLGIYLDDYRMCMHDIALERYDQCRKSFKNVGKDDELSKYNEYEVLKNIYKALVSEQGNIRFHDEKENIINDSIRDKLDMLYEVRDQSRMGASPRGVDSGEVDIMVRRDGFPIVLIEALKINCVAKGYITNHIEKILVKYNLNGIQMYY